MKVFRLLPSDTSQWHTPHEVVSLLTKAYDEIEADENAGREFGEKFIDKYRQLLAAGLGDSTSTPLDVVERQWRDTILVFGRDQSIETAPFYVYVQTESPMELGFDGESTYHQRRRTAKKMATTLEYTVEEFDPDE
jgi:hypothetical protein